jgi:endogenous inhibitor of DNA gyrase (YacG/DUF329 family)
MISRVVHGTGENNPAMTADKPKTPQGRCPVCKQAFARQTSLPMPFCSVRCQQIDLGRWLDENYSVPEPLSLDPDEFPEEEPPTDW